MWRRLLPVLVVAACAEGGPADGLAPSGPVTPGKGDQSCPIVPADIMATQAPYWCGPVDSVNGGLMSDVNHFWHSHVLACGVGPDFPEGVDGAWSLFDYGTIYVGLAFVNGLATSGSLMPAQYVYAHEFGHELEGHYGMRAPTMQQRELTADCLAGYYLGSVVCRGLATEQDVKTTLATACIIADGTGNPITDAETHGTCEQRMTSLAVGMKAYLAGDRPLDACAL